MSHEHLSVSANQELNSAAAAFATVSEELRGDFAPEVYKSWLEALSFAGFTDEPTYLRAPTTVARDWIRQNAQHLIESRMSRLLEAPITIKVEAAAQLPAALKAIRPSTVVPMPPPIVESGSDETPSSAAAA